MKLALLKKLRVVFSILYFLLILTLFIDSIEHFNSVCTACHLCVSACPTHVLQPAYTDYGLIGFMQPVMDNHAGFCNFDCVKCGEVCPTGAIQLLDLET
ncbi:MAG TPA: 4Fe-4S binding protein, partial [Bacteroidales bacterium]|nr:4Fe-4S binding protein [Bacteroidales bacterium]